MVAGLTGMIRQWYYTGVDFILIYAAILSLWPLERERESPSIKEVQLGRSAKNTPCLALIFLIQVHYILQFMQKNLRAQQLLAHIAS